MAAMIAWTAVEVACRIGGALLLRAWVAWLSASRAPGGPSAGVGWGLAAGLVAVNGFYAVTVHHQLFGERGEEREMDGG